ncbi:c-type cytochrome [Dyadobacter sp. CY261]|uniref:c-type cytochrome n=1 Tax=Dyadobacter sp. CY261 TaxID=2907203 RepID=UPI001F3DC520|nr:c-type cytochrome [Dyadobacter sp. CY261]MCF0072782.1 c-type cytochrome [Dyadobacter sp. CY261]
MSNLSGKTVKIEVAFSKIAAKQRARRGDLLWLILAGILLSACHHGTQAISNNISFKGKLSEYELFKGNLSDMVPAGNVVPLQIGSPLFTDYAEKQRLIKIPDGTKVVVAGEGLPVFPNGTLIAKTFYYSKSGNGGRKIIETRLLLYSDQKWNAATYRWNAGQTDAELLTEGAIVPVYFEDQLGKHRHLEYKIPTQKDCGTCHRSGDELVPLGPQARNLNIDIQVEGKSVNQLTYLINRGIFGHAAISGIASLPDYRDSSQALTTRARAYLEMNCAHCHRETGSAESTSLNLNYATPFEETGIAYNKENMLIRMSTMGEYHMPKIGTTTRDEEGVRLIKEYIKSLHNDQ